MIDDDSSRMCVYNYLLAVMIQQELADDEEEDDGPAPDEASDSSFDFDEDDQDDIDGRINGQSEWTDMSILSTNSVADPSVQDNRFSQLDKNLGRRGQPIWQSVGNVSGQAVTFKGKKEKKRIKKNEIS